MDQPSGADKEIEDPLSSVWPNMVTDELCNPSDNKDRR